MFFSEPQPPNNDGDETEDEERDEDDEVEEDEEDDSRRPPLRRVRESPGKMAWRKGVALESQPLAGDLLWWEVVAWYDGGGVSGGSDESENACLGVPGRDSHRNGTAAGDPP